MQQSAENINFFLEWTCTPKTCICPKNRNAMRDAPRTHDFSAISCSFSLRVRSCNGGIFCRMLLAMKSDFLTFLKKLFSSSLAADILENGGNNPGVWKYQRVFQQQLQVHKPICNIVFPDEGSKMPLVCRKLPMGMRRKKPRNATHDKFFLKPHHFTGVKLL